MNYHRFNYSSIIIGFSAFAAFFLIMGALSLFWNMVSAYNAIAGGNTINEIKNYYLNSYYKSARVSLLLLIIGVVLSTIIPIIMLCVKSPYPELEKERIFWGVIGFFLLGLLSGFVYVSKVHRFTIEQRKKTGDQIRNPWSSIRDKTGYL